MKTKKGCIMAIVCTILLFFGMGNALGAPQDDLTKSWTIPFLGTMQVPDNLEIIEGEAVLADIFKFHDLWETRAYRNAPGYTYNPSAEEIKKSFAKDKIGIYQLALKNKGTYNTAFLFVAQIPREMIGDSRELFDILKNADSHKQAEIHKQVTDSVDRFFREAPELKAFWQVEILEFYPFERMANKDAEIVSAGGSMAVRTCKIVQPLAGKFYLIKRASDYYIIAVLDYGQDRKMWDRMTKRMVTHIQFTNRLDMKK